MKIPSFLLDTMIPPWHPPWHPWYPSAPLRLPTPRCTRWDQCDASDGRWRANRCSCAPGVARWATSHDHRGHRWKRRRDTFGSMPWRLEDLGTICGRLQQISGHSESCLIQGTMSSNRPAAPGAARLVGCDDQKLIKFDQHQEWTWPKQMENNVLSAVIPGIDSWFHYQTSQIIVLAGGTRAGKLHSNQKNSGNV